MRLRGIQRFIFLMTIVGMGGVSFPLVANAQSRADSATAQGLFDEGRKLMTGGNYAEACPKLEESQRLDPGSGTLLNLGICYERQGRLASAWTTFLEAATGAKASGNTSRESAARQRAAAVAPRLARVTIRVKGNIPGLVVTRDGAAVRPAQYGTPIPADAGVHAIVVTAPGRKTWETSVTLKDGATELVVIPELDVAEATAKTQRTSAVVSATTTNSETTNSGGKSTFGTQRVLALGAGGIGLAGVVVGSVFGLQAITARNESQESGVCNGAACETTEGAESVERSRRAGNLSTIGFALGGAGLVAGALLWFTAPRGTQIGVGMGTLEVRGSWQ